MTSPTPIDRAFPRAQCDRSSFSVRDARRLGPAHAQTPRPPLPAGGRGSLVIPASIFVVVLTALTRWWR